MMQADVRYTQNFSAENSDSLKPWVPQNGLRWLELVLRADRADGPELVALNAVSFRRLLQQADRVTDPAERQLALDRHLIDRAVRARIIHPAHAIPHAAVCADGDGRRCCC